MAIGIALHIGLNSVDPHKYEGWSGPLNACEADANDMADLAHTQGFAAAKLLTKKATRDAVLKGIADAAKRLKGGDIFFLTYSGTRRAGAGPQRRRARRQGRDVVPL
jgi:metacaspase-1